MSLFNADKVFASLVSAMGLQPQQIQQFVTEIVTELRTWKAEREAFKPAAARAYADLAQRCERIEAKLDALARVLQLGSAQPAHTINGEIHHAAIGYEPNERPAPGADGPGSGGSERARGPVEPA